MTLSEHEEILLLLRDVGPCRDFGLGWLFDRLMPLPREQRVLP